jgi:soluble P-type ATPase
MFSILFPFHLVFYYVDWQYNNTMIELNIPGRSLLQLQHLVCDVNGTLAVDGAIPDGLARVLTGLRDRLSLHLLTADMHGRQHLIDQVLDLQAVRIHPNQEAEQKAAYVRQLGAQAVVAIGQGANDAAMLQEAALGICLLSPEGLAVETLLSADLVVASIFDALQLLEKPLRIVASLRK